HRAHDVLQRAHCAAHAGVHRVVERGVIHAAGQVVAAHPRPIPSPVDAGALDLGAQTHALTRQAAVVAVFVVHALGDAAHGGAAGVARVVAPAALIGEGPRQAGVEVRWVIGRHACREAPGTGRLAPTADSGHACD